MNVIRGDNSDHHRKVIMDEFELAMENDDWETAASLAYLSQKDGTMQNANDE